MMMAICKARILVVAATLATATCCHTKPRPTADAATSVSQPKGTSPMEPKINRQCDFGQVDRVFATFSCTPVFAKDEEDVIRINAPEEVTFTASDDEPLDERTANFIICGAMKMRAETLHKLGIMGNELDALMLVAVDAHSHKSYTGAIPELGTSVPMPPELKKDLPPMLGYTFTESFNPNLVRSFELPAVETDYDVHVVLGPFKSNVLRVKLRRK
jgi:hypothetical protein